MQNTRVYDRIMSDELKKHWSQVLKQNAKMPELYTTVNALIHRWSCKSK